MEPELCRSTNMGEKSLIYGPGPSHKPDSALSRLKGIRVRRTTPALLGLFSLVTLLAHGRMTPAADVSRQAAWYHKAHPTFSDALALVRKELWACATFRGSHSEADTVKVPRVFIERLTAAVCYAA